MAITDERINLAIPPTGSPDPHPMQPNAVLTNQIVKDLRDYADDNAGLIADNAGLIADIQRAGVLEWDNSISE